MCDLQDRPKVLGMTASPVWNPKQPERALKELEDNLRAKVIGVLENQEELLEHSPRPDEVEFFYMRLFNSHQMNFLERSRVYIWRFLSYVSHLSLGPACGV